MTTKGDLVGLLVCANGSYSGAGINPARWFGPAAVAASWRFGAIYACAPIAAALLASGLQRIGRHTRSVPHTGKLFHAPRYRSIFRHDRLPSLPPQEVLQQE